MTETQRNARVVHVVPEAPIPWPQPNRWPDLVELMTMCAALEAELSLDLSEITDKVTSLRDAIDRGSSRDPSVHLRGGIWDLDPAEVERRVIAAGHDRAATAANVGGWTNPFEAALMTEACAVLREKADEVVKVLRKDFDAAATVIQIASVAGLTATTSLSELLEDASPDTIGDYRAVAPAVARLNQIAVLRGRLLEVLRYGPEGAELAVACFVTGVPDNVAMQGAINLWAGELEVVQLNMPFTGSTLMQEQRKRLGGPWLSLVNAGYMLHLNTADETVQVLDKARGGR